MRRLVMLTTAVAVALGAAAPASAQEEPTETGTAPAVEELATSISLQWRRVDLPKAGVALWVNDIITAGGRFIAVGGGVRESPKARARVWTSKSGKSWQSLPLSGSARNGMPRAITRTPGGGFAMVGQGSCPIPCAMTWHSPDATTWERLPEPIEESVMYDVAAFDGRLIAVGCHTPGFHCLAGRVWASEDDGATWSTPIDVPGIMFHALTVVDGQLVATGDSDGFDTAQGVSATSPDGVVWTIHEHGDELGWMRAAGSHGDRALVGGGDHDQSGNKVAATLLASRDDGGFDAIETRTFRKGIFTDVASSKDVLLLSGLFDGKRGGIPYSVVTRDLTTFTRVRFPRADEQAYGEANAVAFSRNGARAVVGGRSGDRGAMWFSRVVAQ
jgi:hypothetical protein